MKRWIMLPAVLLVLALLAGTVHAKYAEGFGTIKSVEDGKVVVTIQKNRDEAGTDTTLVVDKDTLITIGREAKTIDDLKAGARVSVVYKEAEGDGDATAIVIRGMGARGAGAPGGGRGKKTDKKAE